MERVDDRYRSTDPADVLVGLHECYAGVFARSQSYIHDLGMESQVSQLGMIVADFVGQVGRNHNSRKQIRMWLFEPVAEAVGAICHDHGPGMRIQPRDDDGDGLEEKTDYDHSV
jgi:hypothetical protein